MASALSTGVPEKVYAADGLILASPVYYENVSSQMKAFFDRNATRCSHEQWLAPQIVGLIAVAMESGLDDTLAAMRRLIALSNPQELSTVSMGGYADKPGDAAADAQLMAEARVLGRSMAERLGLSPGRAPPSWDAGFGLAMAEAHLSFAQLGEDLLGDGTRFWGINSSSSLHHSPPIYSFGVDMIDWTHESGSSDKRIVQSRIP